MNGQWACQWLWRDVERGNAEEEEEDEEEEEEEGRGRGRLDCFHKDHRSDWVLAAVVLPVALLVEDTPAGGVDGRRRHW